MNPNKQEAAPLERDGLKENRTEQSEDSTKGEWDLDYELDQVADIASPLERDRELQRLKKKFGESLDVLRRELKHRRRPDGPEGPSTVSLVPVQPAPASERQEGIALCEDLATQIGRFLVLPRDGDIVIAAWVLFSHVYDVFSYAPYLAVTSPVKGCGKSTVLDLLDHLVQRPIKAEGFTAASIYRVIEKERPTMLIDELDSYIKGNERLRGVLNSGYHRGGQVVVCVGDDHDPKTFSTWCPKVLAVIGQLPPTIDDRSIKIRMERQLASEQKEGLGPAHHPELLELKRRCIRWADDNRQSLAEPGEVENPFHNRKADRWRPLFTIGKVVGGPWLDMLIRAAGALENTDERSLAVDLLSDIWEIFETQAETSLASKKIVDLLTSAEDKPWGDFNKGNPITTHGLARQLKPFGITTAGRARIGLPNAVRVYSRHSFEEAWSRYLPSGHDFHETNGTTGTDEAGVPGAGE